MDAILTKDNREPTVLKTPRKPKPFSRGGKQDMDELLARLDDTKPVIVPCPLSGCVDTFGLIREDLAGIKMLLHTFLGANGDDGLFQKLEHKVEVNTERIYKMERWQYGMIVGLIVLNLAVQVMLKFFWSRP